MEINLDKLKIKNGYGTNWNKKKNECRKSKWHLMHIEDDGKMEYLLGPCWEIRQDGQGNSGNKDLYKQWIGEGKNQKVYTGKIEFSLCLFEHHTISTNEGVEVQLYAFLTSALNGGE